MKWKVVVTPEFAQEIRDIHSYIANNLLSPKAALNQTRRIMDAVEALSDMPLSFPLYEKHPWHDRGLRKRVVDNFIIFYLTNPKQQEVIILHVFYGGRNIEKLLEEEIDKD